jgi:hypothetical protein
MTDDEDNMIRRCRGVDGNGDEVMIIEKITRIALERNAKEVARSCTPEFCPPPHGWAGTPNVNHSTTTLSWMKKGGVGEEGREGNQEGQSNKSRNGSRKMSSITIMSGSYEKPILHNEKEDLGDNERCAYDNESCRYGTVLSASDDLVHTLGARANIKDNNGLKQFEIYQKPIQT